MVETLAGGKGAIYCVNRSLEVLVMARVKDESWKGNDRWFSLVPASTREGPSERG